MKTSILASLGLVALVNAQATLPACAQTCAIDAIGATGCQLTDAACICTNPAFLTSAQTCIEASCGPADIQAALEYSVSFCASAGVTLTIPSASAPADSPAATPASEPAAATPAPSESVPAGPPVSQISDGQPQATTAESVPAGAPVTQISDGQPQATTGVPATYTGAAMPLQQNLLGGLLGLGMGVVAVL